jgi:hypothetical protein
MAQGHRGELIAGSLDARPSSTGVAPAGAEAASVQFARAMLAGDPTTAGRCFSPAGFILTADGTTVHGGVKVTEVLRQITAAVQELEIATGRTVVADGTALSTQFWRRSVDGPEGISHQSMSKARLVLRQSAAWEIVIASLWE